MNLVDRATNKLRRVFSIPEPLPNLDLRLAAMEKLFRSPPLTKDLVRAIKLISPQYNLKPRSGIGGFGKLIKTELAGANTRRYATYFFCCLIMERSLK